MMNYWPVDVNQMDSIWVICYKTRGEQHSAWVVSTHSSQKEEGAGFYYEVESS